MTRAKQSAIQVMLRQHRQLVASQIANAILNEQIAATAPRDEDERAHFEQARIDAATARKVGKWRT